jgi:hypothetical protein
MPRVPHPNVAHFDVRVGNLTLGFWKDPHFSRAVKSRKTSRDRAPEVRFVALGELFPSGRREFRNRLKIASASQPPTNCPVQERDKTMAFPSI